MGLLIEVAIVLVIVGAVLALLRLAPGIPATVKQIVNIVVIAGFIIWVLIVVVPYLIHMAKHAG